jgi:hypothetical protein
MTEYMRGTGFAGSTAPYGYRTDGQGNLIIFEEEAEVVRLIFAMRASGNTLQRIADHLNAVSIPARRGGRWHPATVRYILDNPNAARWNTSSAGRMRRRGLSPMGSTRRLWTHRILAKRSIVSLELFEKNCSTQTS